MNPVREGEPEMTTDIVTRFLEALNEIAPEGGYLHTDDSPRTEADQSEVPAVGIDGWVYRTDLERVLNEFSSDNWPLDGKRVIPVENADTVARQLEFYAMSLRRSARDGHVGMVTLKPQAPRGFIAAARRFIAAAGRRTAEGGEVELAELLALQGDLDAAILHAVTGIRSRGQSWAYIARATGKSREAAYQKWGKQMKRQIFTATLVIDDGTIGTAERYAHNSAMRAGVAMLRDTANGSYWHQGSVVKNPHVTIVDYRHDDGREARISVTRPEVKS